MRTMTNIYTNEQIDNNTALFTCQTHTYGCALNAALLHDENTMVIILQIKKSINEYVL